MAASNAYARPEFFVDDAYYYFQIAHNIAVGNGSTWDGLSSTNGYHPLWLLVLVPVFFVVRGKVPGMIAAKVVSALLWFAALLELHRIAKLMGAERTFWFGLLPGAVFCAITTKSLPFAGVETGLVFVAAVVVIRLLLETRLLSTGPGAVDAVAPARRWKLGFAFAVLVLSRLDAVVLVGVLMLAIAVCLLLQRRPVRAAIPIVFQIASPTAIALALYLALNQWLFHSGLPVSGRSKQLQPVTDLGVVRTYFRKSVGLGLPIGAGELAAAVLVVVALAIWWSRGRGPAQTDPVARRHRAAMVQLALILGLVYLAGLLTVVYYAFTSGWPLFSWYYYDSMVVLILGPGLVVSSVWGSTAWNRRYERPTEPGSLRGRVSVALAGVLLAGVIGWWIRIDRAGSENFFAQSARAAHALNHQLPPQAVVAMGDRAGVFGYLLDRPVISIEGIVNSTDYLDNYLSKRRVSAFMAREHVDYYARSYFVPMEQDNTRFELGGEPYLGGGNPLDCGRRGEPIQGTVAFTYFHVCLGDVVYRTPGFYRHGDQFVVWRYPGNGGPARG
jgi:hypothetical protein